MIYPLLIQVFISSLSQSDDYLPSTTAMEGVNNLNPLTQAAKPKKITKSKTKTTSVVSQKTIVEKSTKSEHEGSEQVRKVGEGTREHQRILKNKGGEGKSAQPIHLASSQKDPMINKDSNTSLHVTL